jgi:uncharacterized protein YciI
LLAQPSAQDPQVQPGPSESADFVFVFLKAGPQEGQITIQDLKAARDGHFANMKRLSDDGRLLLAGPLGPEIDPADRGLFVFDTATTEEAREFTDTDPAVQAGLLVMELHAWRAPAILREVPARSEAAKQELNEDARGPGANARGYVLALTKDEDAHDRLVEAGLKDRVLFAGDFGGDMEGTRLICLDYGAVEEARSALPEDGDWVLYTWYSTKVLEDLRER